MVNVYAETNLEACRCLWERMIPPDRLLDLWEVRACFHNNFKRDLFFVVAEEGGEPIGLIPLSWIPESNCYGYFPGEVWQGKTWLEQNRLIARDKRTFDQMLRWMKKKKASFNLRYLLPNPFLPSNLSGADEPGYSFYSEFLSYNIDNYYSLFSRKSWKKIHKELDKFYARDLQMRIDVFSDFDVMVEMNIRRFGSESYFIDSRFRESFKQLACFLRDKGFLRITTVIVDGEVAAVDVGSIYNGVYTLLAGGTHVDYPGVAKVINLYHIKTACEEKYKEADFLCGDFLWKKNFHLSPRTLDLFSNVA
ncbi:MAG: GNAT family N-acetyltransferase [Candidatus Omnitrophota bacterium]